MRVSAGEHNMAKLQDKLKISDTCQASLHDKLMALQSMLHRSKPSNYSIPEIGVQGHVR